MTGGLPYFGGPGNNYVTHSIAEMMDTVREKPGSRGLVTANGNYVTKNLLEFTPLNLLINRLDPRIQKSIKQKLMQRGGRVSQRWLRERLRSKPIQLCMTAKVLLLVFYLAGCQIILVSSQIPWVTQLFWRIWQLRITWVLKEQYRAPMG